MWSMEKPKRESSNSQQRPKTPSVPPSQLRRRLIKPNLAMLTRIANLPLTILNHAPHHAHLAAQPNGLALHNARLALADRPQIRAVQRAAHVSAVPEALARHGRGAHGGADVEDERDGAAVQVAHAVAEGEGHVELEGGAGVFGGRGGIGGVGGCGGGDEAEVGAEG